MNKKLFYGAFAFAALGLASCSSDEPVINGGNNNTGTIEGEGYIAINIKTAGTGSTRAITNTEAKYEAGTAAESIKSYQDVRFYFFDADGEPFNMESANNVNGTTVVSNSVTPVSDLTENEDGSFVGDTNGKEVTGEAILVLGKAVGEGYEGLVPYQAICVANLTADQFTALNGVKLSDLADTINDFTATETDMYTPTTFVMTNSNYEGAEQYGANLLGGHVFTTPGEAKNAPVNFFIERLAVKAKVESGLKLHISQDGEGEDAVYTIYDSKGGKREVKLGVKLQDWQLINRAEGSYLIKKLPDTAPFEGWSNAEYHRSFWAISSTEEMTRESFDILNNAKWSTEPKYCYEFTNGTANSVFDRAATTTGIAIRGYVQEQDENGNWNNIDLCRWGGTYYDLDALKQLIANGAARDITKDDVILELDGTTNTYKAYVKDDSVEGEKAELGFQNIQWWNGGATSFYVNIEQADNNGTPVFGVVRNHIYNYTFDNVIGLGIPGNDPAQPTDDETFVAATVNVLNWAVVNNTITLE